MNHYNKLHEDFLEDIAKLGRNPYQKYFTHSFKDILNTIKDDINKITADELFDLLQYIYFYDKNRKDREVGEEFWKYYNRENQQIYEKYGILELYRIPTSNACYSYMNQYCNYIEFYPIEEVLFDEEDEGLNISSLDFLKFNDYMIVLMKRIVDSEPADSYIYVLDDHEMLILDKVVIEYKTNDTLHSIIEDEFNFIKSCIQHEFSVYCPRHETLFRATEFLKKSIQMMKAKINPEINPRIVIVNSF